MTAGKDWISSSSGKLGANPSPSESQLVILRYNLRPEEALLGVSLSLTHRDVPLSLSEMSR